MSEHVHQWSDDEVYAILGAPETETVDSIDHSPPTPHAPSEVVASLDSASLAYSSFLQENVVLIDYGQSFAIDRLPQGYKPATALHYTSPEARFESKISRASDIWALACAIFEIRAGFPLFDPFLGSEADILKQTVQMLGKMPEPWWNSFKDRNIWFEDINGEPKSLDVQRREGICLPAVRSSLQKQLRYIGLQDEPAEVYEGPMFEKPDIGMNEGEVALLSDLLIQMLRYDPDKRFTISDVLRHPWFCDHT